MHEDQQNKRIAAARDFMQSLDQLHNILAQEPQTAEPESHPSEDCSSSSLTDSNVLEEAAADLDQFFGEQEPLEEGMLGEES
jgi:hypothetical protein